MSKALVIVESPAKAKTINKFLGADYLVKASMGHVKDLPKSKLGVDVENNFEPHYITIRSRAKLLKELKTLAKKSDRIFLATDPDREGEAIGWHLAAELKSKDNEVSRIMFNEITKKAIREAIKQPREIDMNLVQAQQARRILDRLFGYNLSPLLWKKVRRGLSAGRVQSVTVRLVVEREKEIEAFVAREYWELNVDLEAAKGTFAAKLWTLEGQRVDSLEGPRAQALGTELPACAFHVKDIQRKEQKRNPTPPFTTSKLQQEASRKLHFTAKKTMLIAQQLYEGLEIGEEGAVGLITYMRTDSVRVAEEAQTEARELITKRYGAEYMPEKPPIFKSKAGVQDAHEAIRPTGIFREPKEIAHYLTPDQVKLYRLIWQRFVASQMNAAVLDVTSVEVAADKEGAPSYVTFKANGSVMRFAGFTLVYTETKEEEGGAGTEKKAEDDEAQLPALQDNEPLKLLKFEPVQCFTQPAPRYNDASLIKALEEQDIGRPSTYAPTLSTILDRRYVDRIENGRLKPSELGVLTTEMLVDSFKDILNVEFTARMEDKLDEIEHGKAEWREVVSEFYKPFLKDLSEAQVSMRDLRSEMEVTTDVICDKCGAKMMVKWGRHGKFLACPNYPTCKNTKPLAEGPDGKITEKVEETLDMKCEKCGSPMIYKQGRFGRFIACSNYPECKNTKALLREIGVDCPKACGGKVVARRSKRGRSFFGCSNYPKCDFVSWGKPVLKPCPVCKAPFMVEKSTRKDGEQLVCATEGCGYKESAPSAEAAASPAVPAA